MRTVLKTLASKVCPEYREAFLRLAETGGQVRCFGMNTAFGVHVLECDNCEEALQGLINHDKVKLEENISKIESSSPYLPVPTSENTTRSWSEAPQSS